MNNSSHSVGKTVLKNLLLAPIPIILGIVLFQLIGDIWWLRVTVSIVLLIAYVVAFVIALGKDKASDKDNSKMNDQ